MEEFATVALDENSETFAIHVPTLNAQPETIRMTIHAFHPTQIPPKLA